MAIERTESGTTITAPHIALFRLHCLAQSLKLRMVGIITRGRSPIKVCNQDYKLIGRTAKVLLPQVEELIKNWKPANER